MLMLEPLPRIITFDCYGTLVQWHRAVRQAARSVLLAHIGDAVSEAQGASLADKLRATAVVHQQRSPYRAYHAVLRSSLEEALAAAGHDATEDDHRTLWSTLSCVPVHPDTAAALARLRSCYRLAIISNTDDDLIADTVAAIGAPVDFVITAQQARAYKPDHRLFEYAHARMGVTKDETIHVGMGQFTDLKVCNELGIRSVWIDREGEPLNPDWTSDAVLPDLSALPDLLLPS
ncbi:MAG: haloacid dehalogenase type II [Janthinobacterium lividum]